MNKAVLVCYKDYEIGCLSLYDGVYYYISLPEFEEFKRNYGFLNYGLGKVPKERFEDLPSFFCEFVERLTSNTDISTKLNINLLKDDYFDVLYRYAELEQDKNTFHFVQVDANFKNNSEN